MNSEYLKKFTSIYGLSPDRAVVAPGRINLIGEHIDYLDGMVMPIAIDRHITVLFRATQNTDYCIWTDIMEDAKAVRIPADTIGNKRIGSDGWLNYILGVLAAYSKDGQTIPGFEAAVFSNLPRGAGLSSSAALETAFALLAEELSGIQLNPLERALRCQWAEHEYANVPCGIMDQLSVAAAKKGKAMLIDCRDNNVEYFNLPDGISFLVSNTGVKHSLGESQYSLRRKQCDDALARLHAKSFRDLSIDQVLRAEQDLGEPFFRRSRHAVTEMKRVIDFGEALQSSDYNSMSRIMKEGHESLRFDFEVSCKELDILVDAAGRIGIDGGLIASRMTGGGFGGSTISIVKNSCVDACMTALSDDYKEKTGRELEAFVVTAAEGAHLIKNLNEHFEVRTAARNNQPHRRWNPLRGEWVLVSPHRTQRPWQGQEEVVEDSRPDYEPDCYLCPGNERSNGEINDDYKESFVFKNDFSALLENSNEVSEDQNSNLFERDMPVSGECRVICYSPRHDLSLAELSNDDIARVIDLWASQSKLLGEKWKWVQLFENKGSAMGCSNPHPHGQIWASDFLPNEAHKEDLSLKDYFERETKPMLIDYAQHESEAKERIVVENEDWIVVVPYWAVWPFETLLLPKKQLLRIEDTSKAERESLSEIMKSLLVRYDNLFKCSFPYSMGWHGGPYTDENNDHWTLHAHFYPPLLRSATVKKFMVGYEMLAESQRDLTAEQAASRLRDMSEVHYKNLETANSEICFR